MGRTHQRVGSALQPANHACSSLTGSELHPAPADPSPIPNRITGRVAASAYQGSLVEYEIESAGRTIRVNETNPKSKPLFQRGDQATVTFSFEDVGIVGE
jgi:hypothetical protein